MTLSVDNAEFMDDEEDWGPPPELAPGKVRIVIEGAPTEPLFLNALASLLLGSATEGSTLFVQRLKEWQAKTDSRGGEIYSEWPDESDAERLRFALIGLLSQAPGTGQKAFSTAVHVSDSVYRVISTLLSPVTSSRLMRPVRRRYDRLAARGETMVEHWIDTGRSAEQRGRALALQAAFDGEDEALDQVIGKMAQKPAVREMVTLQSVGMADEVVKAVRQRSASADTQWERRVRALFRRR